MSQELSYCTNSTFLMSGNLSLIAACTPIPMGAGPLKLTVHTPCFTVRTCMATQN